jgi:hypothetical protein
MVLHLNYTHYNSKFIYHIRDDTGPVRYGMVVSIKAPSAKER